MLIRKGVLIRKGAALVVALALSTSAVACTATGDGASAGSSKETAVPQPTRAQLVAAGLGKLPVAPDGERVDLTMPAFSHPTDITNPLFPISNLSSAILSGTVDNKPFHTETTLLPETRIVEWTEGEQVETRVSQYIAYLGGRLQEAATDLYAQADDGSVWYFGETVFDYRNGVIFSTEGTWLAGRDGPPAMIMPGDPQVGDAHRAENIPGVAFEEVAIKTVGKTVHGPTGPVADAMVARELHDDGAVSDKVFAPGYGEFYTRDRGEVEAMALAVPADALDGPVPASLMTLSSSASDVFDATRRQDWKFASSGVDEMSKAWKEYRVTGVPPRIGGEMERAIAALTSSVSARDRATAGSAAIDVGQSSLDLRLRYQTPASIDLARLEQWARQIEVDATNGDLGGVTGDVASMEWTRDRVADSMNPVDLTRLDTSLLGLSENVADKDLPAASDEALSLRRMLIKARAN